MVELPMARGLLVCEQIIVDQRTRSASLINCTGGWSVADFPSSPQRFCVYTTLTNGRGACELKLRIVNLDDGLPIFERRIEFRFENPRDVLKFSLRVNQCIFPVEGSYAVQLLANNEQISETVLNIDRSGDMP